MKREQIEEVTESKSIGNYFVNQSTNLDFISSGCTLKDCVLGGGYPLGRISNEIGDASTGKTLGAIEVTANFCKQFPDGLAYYHEAEAAFDKEYADSLGMPIDKVRFVGEEEGDEDLQTDTIEGLFSKLTQILEANEKRSQPVPILYILDSLDALSDMAELERDITKGSYSMAKQKILSEIFRRLTETIKSSRMHLMIISQVRDNIGVSFGAKYRRSGGKALDFYASQINWLAEMGKLKKTIKGIERPIGVEIKLKNSKNKVGLPYRDCKYNIIFGYGIDDVGASLEWVEKTKLSAHLLQSLDVTGDVAKKGALHEYFSIPENKEKLDNFIKVEWANIEAAFLPNKKKYA